MAANQPAEPESRVSREPERESVRFGMRTRSVMGVILVLAFALRAIMAVRTSVMFEDGPHFLGVAKLFASGDWAGALSHPYHPLYSAFTAVVERLVHDWEVAALSVSVIAGTAAVLALYLFLREASDPPSAIFGAFLLAISPYGVRFTSDIESEGIYLVFFLAGVALLFRGLARGEFRALVAAGVSAGLAYLARPEGAGLVLVGMGLLVARAHGDGWRAGRLLGACAALAGGAVIVAAPYLGVLMQQRGALVLSGKKASCEPSVFRAMPQIPSRQMLRTSPCWCWSSSPSSPFWRCVGTDPSGRAGWPRTSAEPPTTPSAIGDRSGREASCAASSPWPASGCYIVADDRVPLFSSRGFELRELHRVAAVGRGARVYELIPCTQVESPQPRAGIGGGPSSYARH